MRNMLPTPETFQDERSELKEEASSNMYGISVTWETSHPERSELKEEASSNMRDMLVTPETSHPERSPLKEEASSNMRDMLVTSERSGTSFALYTMFDAPRNADSIDSHLVSPHCSIDNSLFALGCCQLRCILVKSPDMLTV